ncbi:formyl transferase [Neorhizobium sp. JUb45]|uniref:glucosamine inositolphosphorylceramide transferase family protein n=1 Tax=unclassified Neorhizobium TaxID=2629175 RepID=UPI00104D9FB1|nr:formyl transferase [Neorhizobium sp. JUb45]TCQ98226.1 hypothetical protein EDF70_11168 [Neorhizobium sp. JUb45]
MHISLRFDGNHLRQWHVALAERLQALPAVRVSIDARPSSPALPGSLEMLFKLETLLFGLSSRLSARTIDRSQIASFETAHEEPIDLVIDLCGDMMPDEGRVWTISFNGASGEAALLSLLVDRETPTAEISENAHIIRAARLGTEHGGVVLASFSDMLDRTTTMLIAALSGAPAAALPDLGPQTRPRLDRLSARNIGVLASKKLAQRVVQHLYHLCYNAPSWRVGWRRLDGPDLFDLKAHPDTGWKVLADDGRRFYADPFPIVHQGKTTLFVEDYEYSTAKGIISAVTFDADGPVGRPEPVLEHACHLSYPFVFERDGQIWMIPETCAAETVELYRATSFPGGWVKEATLLSGISASDVTLIENLGQWWMFATVRDGGGSYSDALHIWTANDFRGPWTPHRGNPVLIDIASARPAGRMVWRDGALLRPVQDCRKGYGVALGIAQVKRLDHDGFEQSLLASLTSGKQWSGQRIHTLNSAGGFEFIDGSAYAPRWR